MKKRTSKKKDINGNAFMDSTKTLIISHQVDEMEHNETNQTVAINTSTNQNNYKAGVNQGLSDERTVLIEPNKEWEKIVSNSNTILIPDAEFQPLFGWLVVINGVDKGKVFKLCQSESTIGRGSEYTIPLLIDKAVSRQKSATIRWQGSHHIIESHKVSNKSYLNKKELLSEQLLESYDVITIGKTELIYMPVNS